MSFTRSRIPPESVRVPLPRAPALVVARKVPVVNMVPPLCVLVAERVRTPAPALLRVPVPVPIMPPMVVFPAPLTVKPVLVPVIAPKVSKVLALAVKIAPEALRVVDPKVTPAVPEVTVASVSVVSVCAPIARVPSEWVTPAPALVRRELICVLAVTVVLRPKARPVSFTRSRIPPESVRVPLPRAPALVVARKVPVVKTVPPV